MLILTRKVNEQIAIGDNIIISLIRDGHGRIKIGVQAPKDVIVVRAELLSPEDYARILKNAGS